jgi:hypothetical protein
MLSNTASVEPAMIADTSEIVVSRQPFRLQRCCVRIGQVSIGLTADFAEDLLLTPELLAVRANPRACDIEMEIAWVPQLSRPQGSKLFDSGSLWTLYAGDSGFSFDFTTPVLGDQPYKRLLVDREFSTARLLMNRECLSAIAPVYPLEYPLDELLVTGAV